MVRKRYFLRRSAVGIGVLQRVLSSPACFGLSHLWRKCIEQAPGSQWLVRELFLFIVIGDCFRFTMFTVAHENDLCAHKFEFNTFAILGVSNLITVHFWNIVSLVLSSYYDRFIQLMSPVSVLFALLIELVIICPSELVITCPTTWACKSMTITSSPTLNNLSPRIRFFRPSMSGVYSHS